MKRNSFPALFLVAGMALFLTGIWYGHRSANPSAPQLQRRILYYVDPMNPAHTSQEPGLAPCGMKMEPVYASTQLDAGSSARPGLIALGTVRISSEKQHIIGIQVAQVEKAPATYTMRLFGRVAPDDRRVYRLNAGVDGIVREVSAVSTGTQIKKDQWLATFSAPDARATLQGFAAAVDVLNRQQKSGGDAPGPLGVLNDNVRLAAERLQGLGLSSLQIDEIRTTREVPAALRIHAPVNGFVLAQDVTPGLKFEKGNEWYRIADLSRVWVLADAHAQDTEHYPPGAMAQVSLAGQKKLLPARVSESLPQIDPVTGTLKVRFEVDNPDSLLRPEMLVDVILSVTLPPALMVSADALLETGLTATVFVARDHGVFEPRVVETGRRLAGQVEILRGLEPGEQIVTAGNFLIDSESRMKLAAPAAPESGHKDPICGMKVDEQAARAAHRFSAYQDRTYFFCNVVCRDSFEQNPARFTQGTTLAQAPDHADRRAPPRLPH